MGGLTIINPDFRSRSVVAFRPPTSARCAHWRYQSGGAPLSINYVGNVSPRRRCISNHASGVADADEKCTVSGSLTTRTQAAPVVASSAEGVPAVAPASPAVATSRPSRGSLVDGSNNTLGTLDVYLRDVNTDTSLTKVGSFTSAGLNSMAWALPHPRRAPSRPCRRPAPSGRGLHDLGRLTAGYRWHHTGCHHGHQCHRHDRCSPAGATVGSNTVSGVILHMDGAASPNRSIQFETAGSPRWIVQTDRRPRAGQTRAPSSTSSR